MSNAPQDAAPPPVSPQITEAARLDRHLVSGIAWTAAAKWMTQLFGWASLIIVARLLSPADFGIVGMATLYLGLIQNFSEFGIGTAIVTLRDLSNEQIAQINAVAVISGIAGVLLSCAVAAPLGKFFHTPKLPLVVVAMSMAFLIAAFKAVPDALLQREMRFKSLSLVATLQAMIQALATLVLAWLGFSYWSLVLGNILGVLAGTVGCIAYRRHGFRRPRLCSIRHAIRFSWHILVSRLCWYGYSNADFLVAGRVLGPAPLGAYTLAWNIANVPVEKVTALVGQVTPTVFSAVQSDRSQLRRYLRILTEGITLVTLPAALGLALVAPDLVHVMLGSKWDAAIPALQLLAVYVSLRSITPLLPQVLNVVGETRFGMWNGVLAVIVMPTLFLIGSRWGTRGIALGWVIGYPIVAAPLYWRTFTRIRMAAGEYLSALRAPLSAAIPMVAAVLLVQHAPALKLSQLSRLTAEVLAGAATYSALLWRFHSKRLKALYAIMKSARQA